MQLQIGDWGRSDQMKNFIPTLGIGLRKLIHRKYQTVTVDEAYTSRRCSGCHQDLRNYIDDKTELKVHRLLVCEKCVSCENKGITFRSRDSNAAINIMNVAKHYILTGQRHPKFEHRSSPNFSKIRAS